MLAQEESSLNVEEQFIAVVVFTLIIAQLISIITAPIIIDLLILIQQSS